MSEYSLVVRGYVRSGIDYVVDTVPIIGLDIEKPMALFGCGLNVHP